MNISNIHFKHSFPFQILVLLFWTFFPWPATCKPKTLFLSEKRNIAPATFSQPLRKHGRFYNAQRNGSYNIWDPFKHVTDALNIFVHAKLRHARLPKQRTTLTPRSLQCEETTITWLGHATFLIETPDITIITDPVFDNLSLLYPRIMPLGIKLSDLPSIDIIIISHNHRDHMDTKSLRHLRSQQPLVMVPQGNRSWFKRRGFNHVVEYSWWEQQNIQTEEASKPISITCVPATHNSGRWFFDANKTLWVGWVFTTDTISIYFAGDTAYNQKQFAEIGSLFPTITYALLPIAPHEPRRHMKDVHMEAKQAVQAYLDLDAKYLIPMHWGTFALGAEEINHPIKIVHDIWNTHNLNQDNLQILATKKA